MTTSTLKRQSARTNPAADKENPLRCRMCNSPDWIYDVTKGTRISFAKGVDPATTEASSVPNRIEIHCANCGRKATIANNAAIRSTEAFRAVVAIEQERETKCVTKGVTRKS